MVPINQELLQEMQHHLFTDPDKEWIHCHSAASLLVLLQKFPIKVMTMQKLLQAMWSQTKALEYDRHNDQELAGYDPKQSWHALPTVWTKDPYGLYYIPVSDDEHAIQAQPRVENAKGQQERPTISQ